VGSDRSDRCESLVSLGLGAAGQFLVCLELVC
jgi:hypothetical protein